jgi:hypothetical protein
VAAFVVWFLTCLWSAETLVSVFGVSGGPAMLVAAITALVPALLVRRCIARHRLKRTQQAAAAAWHARPPPPHGPPPQQHPVEFPLLQLRAPFSRAEAIAAFRRQALHCHPDHGGDTAIFRMLVAERMRALEVAR